MRINLVSTFAEKDAVKALGARWDAAKKVWYITHVEDLSPFRRWIPGLETYTEGWSDGAIRQARRTRKAPMKMQKGVFTGPAVVEPHCGCSVQPWEDCVHTVYP
jgi:hypothetical protein